MGSGRLSGKVAIVTGAASGIGKATVELFRSEGAEVDRRRHRRGRRHRPHRRRPRRGRPAPRRPCGRRSMAASTSSSPMPESRAGSTSIFEQTAEDWAEILRINLIGPFLAIKHAAPVLKARGGGSIICTASVAGLRSGAGGAAYSASKAGVINLVQTAAQQLSGTGIRVNAICPGLIETGMTEMIYYIGARQGPGPSHRRIEPAQPRRRARRDRQGGLVPGVGRNRATSTARRWSSMAACRAAIPTDPPLRHQGGLTGSDRSAY